MGVIVGTAGHIDHGKSTLMLALTGRDPDRLKEEKARGITIELGYVFLGDGKGGTISFIDVPGHEKFVRTMVAGVSTVDCFLLVVSADEGVMPQTREHLDILRLLEVDTGIVALSKCDLVDGELIELAEEEVREALKGTPAEKARVIRVSAKTGEGLEVLKKELLDMAASVPVRSSEGRFRMPVDRIFTLKGFGTIVCGTGLSGTVSTGDQVEILPAARKFRVRELGVNDSRKAELGQAGDRIALNLTGLRKEDVHRGSVAGEPGYLKVLKSLDTTFTMLPGNVDLSVRQRVRFHVGTAEVMARAIPVEGRPLLRGETGYVHFQLEQPVVAMPGDRFVVRRYSPVITIGGGVILDTDTAKVRNRFREVRLEHLDLLTHGSLEDQLFEAMEDNEQGFVESDSFLRRSGADPVEYRKAVDSLVEQGRAVVTGEGKSEKIILAAAVEDLERKVRGAVSTVHRNVPLSPGMPSALLARKLPGGTPVWAIRHTLASMEHKGEIVRRGDFLALSSFPEELQGKALEIANKLIAKIEGESLSGWSRDSKEISSEDIEALLARGLLLQLDDALVTTPSLLEKASRLLRSKFKDAGFRLGEMREVMGVSRKYALPWAELMDSTGITRRDGDLRFLR